MPTVKSDGLIISNDGERRYIDIDGLRLKVPWRYNRVTGVEIKGLKTLQELKNGDVIKEFTFTSKKWNNETFYVLKSINTE